MLLCGNILLTKKKLQLLLEKEAEPNLLIKEGKGIVALGVWLCLHTHTDTQKHYTKTTEFLYMERSLLVCREPVP